jgi:hypothetical protein
LGNRSMNAGLIARLVRAEARFPPAPRRWDMSGLRDDELEILATLPIDEAGLRALIEAPGYDWMPLARIIDRLIAV